MNVFEFRNRLVGDFSSYVRSFINIKDERINEHVQKGLDEGALWPEPLIQLNPSFEPGGKIDDLVEDGTLHAACGAIFRRDKDKPEHFGKGTFLRLHKHQEEAIRCARRGENYVLTTGTGSGKSLAYIVPIVDHVLRRGSGKGIQAIVVYPMNALANSQWNELDKFLCEGFPDRKGPVTFEKYTGQESRVIKDRIILNPQDILLTNYVMLELILTRTDEINLVAAAKGLKFLVLDELHTYRGRQGADVSLLVRRVRNAMAADHLQHVGTSATLAGAGSPEEQRKQVAEVASTIFGSAVKPENVIGETLKRTTAKVDTSSPAFLDFLKRRVSDPAGVPPVIFKEFIEDPLSVWLEDAFGLDIDPETQRLSRKPARGIWGENGAAKELGEKTGVPAERCAQVIQQGLLAGFRCGRNPDTHQPPFAFRLHQFIGKGDTAYASLEEPKDRFVTIYRQQFVPGDPTRSRVLLPLAFCRECGQEYYTVFVTVGEDGRKRFIPRSMDAPTGDDSVEAGFLYLSDTNPWSNDVEEIHKRIPSDWIEEMANGTVRVKKTHRDKLPQPFHVGPDGVEGAGLPMHFVPGRFRFCLNPDCKVAYRHGGDYGKLGTLSSEGRSTATTVLSMSAIRQLKAEETLKPEARKLLSFTDNRQDASLQSGHFNDFVEIGVLRAALAKATKDAGPDGITHEKITGKVFEALGIPFASYAAEPGAEFGAKKETERALREVLGYRLYRDLERGWRITSPTLEQSGLLRIQYQSLDELCADEPSWAPASSDHVALSSASPAARMDLAKVLLDFMRRELAIEVDYLNAGYQDQIRQLSNQRLAPPWSIDEDELFIRAFILFPRQKRPREREENIFLSPYSAYGKYVRKSLGGGLTLQDTEAIIAQLLRVLSKKAGLISTVYEPREGSDDVPGYQIKASAMLWLGGDGKTAFYDPLRILNESSFGGRTNPYFVGLYQSFGPDMLGLEAHEHTAQVPYEEREAREKAFRKALLPILYCSPTMELGVDIAELNVVNLRNVPPTPANYAQRSGRAGRSGQPAFVFSYCTASSHHDQYFFRRPEQMVSGSVTPPRVDIANEDLVRAHVHAIWLAETRQSLHESLKDLLDLGTIPGLPLAPSVLASVSVEVARKRAKARAKQVLASVEKDLAAAGWCPDLDKWLDDVFLQVVQNFDRACDRWRSLYLAARRQMEVQQVIMLDHTATPAEKDAARGYHREAMNQMALLTEIENVAQSDFYSYRYFASEGFLPGYSFPRLPLSAYIPGRRNKKNKNDYISRPRFLAITEFGPQAYVYHEGAKYRIARVILPVGEDDPLTRQAKRCEECGYIHDGTRDKCERPGCGALLPAAWSNLFQLQNVVTRRTARINSDEEERQRMGYEVITGIRFTEHGMRPASRDAHVDKDGEVIAGMTYANAANLWRINLGWVRRKDRDKNGFLLHVLGADRGKWSSKNFPAADDGDDGGPEDGRVKTVIPYVEDHRNCLIFTPPKGTAEAEMASLQYALKNAIQVYFQLEDNELASESLPSRDDRRSILLFESAEGGAGVLRRLIDDPCVLGEVAKTALELCHFDPATGDDKRRAPRAKEDCEAACYDCLLGYGNQGEHELLDRKIIKDYLLALATAKVVVSPGAETRAESLARLRKLAGSGLEKKWLDFIDGRGLHLPTHGQKLVVECHTQPDFIYANSGNLAAIYVDGPTHDFPDRHKRDVEKTAALEDLGYLVIRFRHDEEWSGIVAKHPSIFGSGK